MVEIIHLGDYWDEEKMMKNKELIIKDNTEVGRMFKRAYGYLAAAKGAYDNLNKNIEEAIDHAKVNKIYIDLANEVFDSLDYAENLGNERHLFGSAITPDGIRDYLETLIEPNNKVIVLKGKYDSSQSEVLKKLGVLAINKGYDVEFYHNHFIPEKVDNIVIKDISVAITTSDKFDNGNNKVIDIDKCLNEKLLKEREEEIKLDKEKYEELIALAVVNVGKAKKVHDHMETYYIPNMDFEAVDCLRENTLERIIYWAEED